MKKLLEICKLSLVTSFCLILLLIVVNSLMGIFIKLNYYLVIQAVMTVGFMIGLLMLNKGNIFKKKKSVNQMTVVKSKTVKTTNNRTNQQKQVRRKIS